MPKEQRECLDQGSMSNLPQTLRFVSESL